MRWQIKTTEVGSQTITELVDPDGGVAFRFVYDQADPRLTSFFMEPGHLLATLNQEYRDPVRDRD